MEFIEAVLASTSNEVDTEMHNGSAFSFIPTTLDVKTNAGTSVQGVGKMNIDYAINNGAFTGSLIDIETFKELSPTIFDGITQLDFRLQPIGLIVFDSVEIWEHITELSITGNGGITMSVNAIPTASIDINGSFVGDGSLLTGIPSKYTETIGDSSTNPITITHGLATREITYSI